MTNTGQVGRTAQLWTNENSLAHWNVRACRIMDKAVLVPSNTVKLFHGRDGTEKTGGGSDRRPASIDTFASRRTPAAYPGRNLSFEATRPKWRDSAVFAELLPPLSTNLSTALFESRHPLRGPVGRLLAAARPEGHRDTWQALEGRPAPNPEGFRLAPWLRSCAGAAYLPRLCPEPFRGRLTEAITPMGGRLSF